MSEKLIEQATERIDFKTKSNNWLKLHGKRMRRKPCTRSAYVFDEFENISGFQETIYQTTMHSGSTKEWMQLLEETLNKRLATH